MGDLRVANALSTFGTLFGKPKASSLKALQSAGPVSLPTGETIEINPGDFSSEIRFCADVAAMLQVDELHAAVLWQRTPACRDLDGPGDLLQPKYLRQVWQTYRTERIASVRLLEALYVRAWHEIGSDAAVPDAAGSLDEHATSVASGIAKCLLAVETACAEGHQGASGSVAAAAARAYQAFRQASLPDVELEPPPHATASTAKDGPTGPAGLLPSSITSAASHGSGSRNRWPCSCLPCPQATRSGSTFLLKFRQAWAEHMIEMQQALLSLLATLGSASERQQTALPPEDLLSILGEHDPAMPPPQQAGYIAMGSAEAADLHRRLEASLLAAGLAALQLDMPPRGGPSDGYLHPLLSDGSTPAGHRDDDMGTEGAFAAGGAGPGMATRRTLKGGTEGRLRMSPAAEQLYVLVERRCEEWQTMALQCAGMPDGTGSNATAVARGLPAPLFVPLFLGLAGFMEKTGVRQTSLGVRGGGGMGLEGQRKTDLVLCGARDAVLRAIAVRDAESAVPTRGRRQALRWAEALRKLEDLAAMRGSSEG